MYLPDKFRVNGDCIEWTGRTSHDGYGLYGNTRIHRLMYEVFIGQIPLGSIVCHQCDNRLCCRPEHLWLGTIADNNRDMSVKGRASNQHKGKTHCKNGHEYTPENTYNYGYKMCKTCAIGRVNKQRALKQRQ